MAIVNWPPSATPHVAAVSLLKVLQRAPLAAALLKVLEHFKAAHFSTIILQFASILKSPLFLLHHPFINAAGAHCFIDEANPIT